MPYAKHAAKIFKSREPVRNCRTGGPCCRLSVLPARSKTELGNQPQEAQEPHSGLDVLLHGFLCLSIFTLILHDWVKILYRLTKTVSSSPLLFAMIFDVGGATSFRVSSHKTCHQERRHPCFSCSDQQKHPYLYCSRRMTLPVAPLAPRRGTRNEAAGLFATKTPAFTTQNANPRRLINIRLSHIAHPLLIEHILRICSELCECMSEPFRCTDSKAAPRVRKCYSKIGFLIGGGVFLFLCLFLGDARRRWTAIVDALAGLRGAHRCGTEKGHSAVGVVFTD